MGEACQREGDVATWEPILTYYRTGSAALYSHLLNNFSFSYIKKTTKSWHIISSPVHPIMIQWIIYFPKLNHLGSHFLPCRQKPLFFTHGFQLVFIEAFKIYLNTERFKKSCFIFLSQLLSQYHFVLVFFKFSVSKAEKQRISLLRLCFVTGQGGVGFYLEVDISFEYIYNLFFLHRHFHVHLYTCMSYFSLMRF